MVIFNTVQVDGLIIRTAWDDNFVGPTELHVTLDLTAAPSGRVITERALRRYNFQSMCPDELKDLGSLRVVGEWLEAHKPGFRERPLNPQQFYAHVALFFVLTIQEGERGAPRVLANYAGVRPRMADQWIRTARRLGMLSTNGTGQAGRSLGALTEKARAILVSKSESPDDIAGAAA